MDAKYIQNQIKALIKSRDELMLILDEGANQISTARDQGKDVNYLEDIWTGMLNDYGKISDQIRELQGKLAA